jgi:glycosyltransferase involved in cell wall biosynthesis
MNSDQAIIDVIIPVFNEEDSIGRVIADIPTGIVRDIIVCNNASTDKTGLVALNKGATVVNQPERGYGNACLKGLEHIERKQVKPDIVVFLDGDYSDYPSEMIDIVNPIITENVDLVIGSRALGEMEKGAMMPQQIFGNWLAITLIKLFFDYEFSDLGPFRAIKYSALQKINMVDKNFGWTVEMQVKAAKEKLIIREIPVSYRKRIGESKVSGTVKGTILAGYKILWTIFKYI